MQYVTVTRDDAVVVIQLCRGKVNALNDTVVAELGEAFEQAKSDPGIGAVILTGSGKFFSFGFDIPEFLSYSKEEFSRYLTNFTNLYREIFVFPKPVIAALNGHTVAGGCMLATACDYRLMVQGKARISLNEIGFGSSVFAGSVEMLQFCVGERHAQSILYSGALYSAEQAFELGLVDQTTSVESIAEDAGRVARENAGKDARAYQSIKSLLRGPVAESMKKREAESIQEFVEIWYSPDTWKRLHDIKIHG